MTDHDTMRDEGLAIGQPLVIWLSVVERFIDERPATLVRVDVDDATGARRLLVRDETNGVLDRLEKGDELRPPPSPWLRKLQLKMGRL